MCLKGTHNIYFSISFCNINQKPKSPRTNFHCETMHVLLGETRQSIWELFDSLLR